VTVVEAILLPVGEEWHAIELRSVQEVLPVPPITPVPSGPPWLIGLINRRGELLPVIDTGASFGLGATEGLSHVAVADTRLGPVAVAATGAPEPVRLTGSAGPGDHPAAAGRFVLAGSQGDRVATLVTLDVVIEAG
jgi:hypothetical protein